MVVLRAGKYLTFIFVLLLWGCQSNHSSYVAEGVPYLKSGKSLLVISLGEYVPNSLTILVNDRAVAAIASGQVLFVHVPKGAYRVRSSSINSFPLELQVSHGETAHVIATNTDKGTYFKLAIGADELGSFGNTDVIEVNY